LVEVLDLEIGISPHSFVARTRERETVQWSACIRRSAQVTAHALCNPSLPNAAWRDHESNLRKILSPSSVITLTALLSERSVEKLVADSNLQL
jgi:hypothetical protein